MTDNRNLTVKKLIMHTAAFAFLAVIVTVPVESRVYAVQPDEYVLQESVVEEVVAEEAESAIVSEDAVYSEIVESEDKVVTESEINDAASKETVVLYAEKDDDFSQFIEGLGGYDDKLVEIVLNADIYYKGDKPIDSEALLLNLNGNDLVLEVPLVVLHHDMRIGTGASLTVRGKDENGNLTTMYDMDIDGGTLIVDGSYYQKGEYGHRGTLKFSDKDSAIGGTMKVGKNLKIDGNYNGHVGITMLNEHDNLTIGENFTFGGNIVDRVMTAGTMTVGGDITTEKVTWGTLSVDDAHITYFGGERIHFDTNMTNRLGSFGFTEERKEEITDNSIEITGGFRCGKLLDDVKLNAEGNIGVRMDTNGHDVIINAVDNYGVKKTVTLESDIQLGGKSMTVDGNLTTRYHMNLEGGNLSVTGAYYQQGAYSYRGTLTLGNGSTMEVGSLTINGHENGYVGLVMTDPKDSLTVNGDFFIGGYYVDRKLENGTLTIKGDITSKAPYYGNDSISPDHRTIFGGDSVQFADNIFLGTFTRSDDKKDTPVTVNGGINIKSLGSDLKLYSANDLCIGGDLDLCGKKLTVDAGESTDQKKVTVRRISDEKCLNLAGGELTVNAAELVTCSEVKLAVGKLTVSGKMTAQKSVYLEGASGKKSTLKVDGTYHQYSQGLIVRDGKFDADVLSFDSSDRKAWLSMTGDGAENGEVTVNKLSMNSSGAYKFVAGTLTVKDSITGVNADSIAKDPAHTTVIGKSINITDKFSFGTIKPLDGSVPINVSGRFNADTIGADIIISSDDDLTIGRTKETIDLAGHKLTVNAGTDKDKSVTFSYGCTVGSTGELTVNGNMISNGRISLAGGKLTVDGDLTSNSIWLGSPDANVHVKKDLTSRYEVKLDGGKLTVDGEHRHTRDNLTIGGGTLTAGRLTIQNDGSNDIGLVMTDEADEVIVAGDLKMDSGRGKFNFSKGILTVNGNMTGAAINSGSDSCKCTVDHITKVGGTLDLSAKYYLGTVMPISANGTLKTTKYFNAARIGENMTIVSDGDIIVNNNLAKITDLADQQFDIAGHNLIINANNGSGTITFERGFKLGNNGNLTLKSVAVSNNRATVAGGTFTAEKTFYQTYASFWVGNGKATFEGDFCASNADADRSTSKGFIYMADAAGKMTVLGDVYLNSSYDNKGRLQAGEIYLKGNFTAEKGSNTWFQGSLAAHRTILDGNGEQTVSLKNTSGKFGTLDIPCKREGHYTLSPANCAANIISGHSYKCSGYSQVEGSSNIKSAIKCEKCNSNAKVEPIFNFKGYTVSVLNELSILRPSTKKGYFDLEAPGTWAGYTFAGWYDNESFTGSALSSIQVDGTAAVITLYAKWIEQKKAVTVTFDSQGGSSVASQVYETDSSGCLITRPQDPEKAGYTFEGWYKDNVCSEGQKWNFVSDKVSGNTSLYAKWAALPTYNVTFSYGNGTSNATSTVIEGNKVDTPTEPSRTGYVFDGWYADAGYNKEWDFGSDVVSQDVTIYAKWLRICTVSFDGQNGKDAVSANITEGQTAESPAEPQKAGYVFGGWYKEEACTNAWDFDNDRVTADITLYAKWTKENLYVNGEPYETLAEAFKALGTPNQNYTITLLADASYNGNITDSYWTLDLSGHTLTVTGDMTASRAINLGSGTLKVNGTYTQSKGSLAVGGGTMEAGNVVIKDASALVMSDTDGKMTVNGDLSVTGSGAHNLTDGKLTVKGNLSAGTTGNMTYAADHITAVGGTLSLSNKFCLGSIVPVDSETVVKTAQYFNVLAAGRDMTITSDGNIIVDNSAAIKSDNSNVPDVQFDVAGHTVTMKAGTGGNGTITFKKGFKLSDGNLTLESETVSDVRVNANGGSLTAKKDYYQTNYSFWVGDGKAVFEKDFCISGAGRKKGSGHLYMSDPDGSVTVCGEMYLYSSYSKAEKLKAGNLYLKGNFTARDSGCNKWLQDSSGDHVTTLIGDAMQKISIDCTNGRLGTIVIPDERTAGYTITPANCYVTLIAKTPDEPQPPVTFDVTVTFDSQGGSDVSSQTVRSGEHITKPSDPTRAGYTFGGWYKEAACTNGWDFENETLVESITLYAKWTKTDDKPDTPDNPDNPDKPDKPDKPEDDDDRYTVYNPSADADGNVKDVRIDLSSCTIAPVKKTMVYCKKPYEPAPKVTLNGKTLVAGADYRLVYSGNTDAGTYTIEARGIGNYKGASTNKSSFTISPKPIKKLTIVKGTISAGDVDPSPVLVYDGTTLLEEAKDYTCTISGSFSSPGTVKATIKMNNKNYIGEKVVKVSVIDTKGKKSLSDGNVVVGFTDIPAGGYVYEKNVARKPAVSVSVGGVLVTPADYTVSYKNNKNAGTAYAIVTAKKKSEYAGKAMGTFEIRPATSPLEITVKKNPTYNGKLQKPTVTVKAGGKKLSKNKDYVIEYKYNINAGTKTAQAIVTGIGNYEREPQVELFDIEKKKLTASMVKSGKTKGIWVVFGKKTLVEKVDYNVEYTPAETGNVSVTFKALEGNFTGSVTKNISAAAVKVYESKK